MYKLLIKHLAHLLQSHGQALDTFVLALQLTIIRASYLVSNAVMSIVTYRAINLDI